MTAGSEGSGGHAQILAYQIRHGMDFQAFCFLGKKQATAIFVEIRLNPISRIDLAGGHQVRHGLNQQAFDCAFQMTRAVFQVSAFCSSRKPLAVTETLNTNDFSAGEG